MRHSGCSPSSPPVQRSSSTDPHGMTSVVTCAAAPSNAAISDLICTGYTHGLLWNSTSTSNAYAPADDQLVTAILGCMTRYHSWKQLACTLCYLPLLQQFRGAQKTVITQDASPQLAVDTLITTDTSVDAFRLVWTQTWAGRRPRAAGPLLGVSCDVHPVCCMATLSTKDTHLVMLADIKPSNKSTATIAAAHISWPNRSISS